MSAGTTQMSFAEQFGAEAAAAVAAGDARPPADAAEKREEDALAELEAMCGGAGEAGGEAEGELSLTAMLSREELRAIVEDADAPADLFAEAGSAYVGHFLSRGEMDYQAERVFGEQVEKVYKDPRGRGRGESPLLLRHAMRLLDCRHYSVSNAVREFVAEADLPVGEVARLVRGVTGAWAIEEVETVLHLVASRAARLSKTRAGEAADEIAALVALVEEVFADERASVGREERVDEKTTREVAPVRSSLMSLLETLYPAHSAALLGAALDAPAEAWTHNAARHARLREAGAEETICRFLALRLDGVDERLLSNPLLGEHHLWRIVARHAGSDPVKGGTLMGASARVREFAESSGFGALARGMVRRCGRADMPEDAVTDGLLALAVGDLLAQASAPADVADTPLARRAFARLPQETAAAIVGLKCDALAEAVMKEWHKARRDGALLDALLKYPRKDVRLKLITREPKHYWEKLAGVETKDFTDEERELFRTKILPHFADDRARDVREISMTLLLKLAEGGAEKKTALQRSTLRDLKDYAEKQESLSGEDFRLIFDRCSASKAPAVYYQHAENPTSVLVALAARRDLSRGQYDELAALRRDPVSAALAFSFPRDAEGGKEFLKGLRAAGDQTCAALAVRPEWDEFERPFYIRHKAEAVRKAVAARNTLLNVHEVAELLCDASKEVYKALTENPAWPRYAKALRERVGG